MLKQARATAKIQCVNPKDSSAAEENACNAVREIFNCLEDFATQDLRNPCENQRLTSGDKTKLQAKLREFFKNQSFLALQSDFEIPPTLLAVLAYDRICSTLNNPAPYRKIKLASIQKAKLYKQKFLESLQEKIKNLSDSKEILEFAIRICVLGNVLDYGAQKQFCLEEQAKEILESSFAFFDLESFMSALKSAKNLVIIGDNAGENELDEILIYALKALYPTLDIFYFVRGAEIINDITLRDLKASDSALFNLAKVVDSGVVSPGFIEFLANAEAKAIYKEADLILAKGMGNFESMESQRDARVFFLFKIKCDVVKNYLRKNLGDFAFFNPSLHKIP